MFESKSVKFEVVRNENTFEDEFCDNEESENVRESEVIGVVETGDTSETKPRVKFVVGPFIDESEKSEGED